MEAFRYLHDWLKYHPDYSNLSNVQDGQKLDFNEINNSFLAALEQKPGDAQVLLALGVLQFIERDYIKAAVFFEQAIREDPTNHSLWNKYGAALAQNLKTTESVEAYQQALDLRPNYVRTIVNLGLAHNNVADFKSAANCLINALILNPHLTHVRTYLQTAFIQMKRYDLVEKLKLNDLQLFKDEFMLIDPNNLQKPSLDKLYANAVFQK